MTEPAHHLDDEPPIRPLDRARRGTELALVSADLPPAPPPEGAVLHPPIPTGAGRQWFPVQLWNEFRLAVRMYFDPRYRISRAAQFLFPLIGGLFLLNYFLFAIWLPIWIISPVLERVGCVLLGVFAYKVLTRELTRYREVLDYLARYSQR